LQRDHVLRARRDVPVDEVAGLSPAKVHAR
jgi:hypothetical protein